MDSEARERLLHADVPTVEKELSGALNALVAVYRQAQERMHPDTPAYKWCETKVGAVRDYANSAPGRREWIIATIEMAEIEKALAKEFVAQSVETYAFAEAPPEPIREEPAAPAEPVPSADMADLAEWARLAEQARLARSAAQAEPADDTARDSLFIVVTRSEVESGDTERVLSLLHALTDTPEIVWRAQGTVDLRFDGFDDEPDDLFEIDAVREYVGKLDDVFPYWLFFGDTRTMSLQTVTQCFLPKFLTLDEQIEQIPRELNELLNNRWLPAMDYIAEFAGWTPDQVKALRDSALTYYTKAPAELRA